MRIRSGTLVQVLFGPSYSIRDSQGSPLGFTQISAGDHLTTSATPDPQRALVFTAFNVVDRSVRSLRNVRALATNVEQGGGGFEALIGADRVEVDLQRSTRIVLPGGQQGSIADLVGSQVVHITGLLNTKTLTVLQTSVVSIDTAPARRLSVVASQPNISAGGRQTLLVTASTGRVGITIRYPNRHTYKATIVVGRSGKATLSFTIPHGVNSPTSTNAVVTIASRGRATTTHFTVRRETVEVYVGHRSLRPGQRQSLLLFGPKGTKLLIRVSWPGGAHLTHDVRLDSHGHAGYSFDVPRHGIPARGGTAGVRVTSSAHGATHLASTAFKVG